MLTEKLARLLSVEPGTHFVDEVWFFGRTTRENGELKVLLCLNAGNRIGAQLDTSLPKYKKNQVSQAELKMLQAILPYIDSNPGLLKRVYEEMNRIGKYIT